MKTVKETLFSPFATGGDVSHLFRVAPSNDGNTLFSSDITALTKQFTSKPVDILPQQQQDVPPSTLFGIFSEDVQPPPSPASSIMSLPEEVTQHTIPEDDVWEHADSHAPLTRKVDTWESFGMGRRNISIGVNPFVTEQSPKMFDELLRRHMNHIYSPNESGIVVDEHLFREVVSLIVQLIIVSSRCLCRPRIFVVPLE